MSARRGREEHSATDDDYDEIHLKSMSRAAALIATNNTTSQF